MKHAKRPGIHRGVSTFSFYPELNWTLDLDDIFMHMQDIGAYGLEILADGNIQGYPNPSSEWLDWWFATTEKYEIVPVEYGHWVESRMFPTRDYTTEEALEMLVHDIKLASFMGFTCMRTKLGVIDEILTPVENWREFVKAALPYAEKYDVVMQPEIHSPTLLKSTMVDEFCEFIDKEQTKHFGLNIDFGVFQPRKIEYTPEGHATHSEPEDIIPLLPYVYCCHAKYSFIDDNYTEPTIPYEKVIRIMQEQNWSGYLLSEFSGKTKSEPGSTASQIRKQHVLLKRLLGE